MKKYIVLPLAILALFGCESNTYEDISEETIIDGNTTYSAHIRPIIQANCVSCHSAAGVASFRPLGTYTEVKDAVENAGLLNRIQLQNGEPGLMPQAGRMPQTTINLMLKWNEDGLLEN